MNADFDAIYAELAARHGAATVLDKAVCRQVAKVLVADDVSAGDVVAANALLAQLPKAAEAKPWDLGKLTDGQLRVLEKLGAIARGEAPAVPEHRRKSTRYWLAVELAAKLDAAAVRPGGANEIDNTELRSLVMSLILPLLVQDLFRETFKSAFAPYASATLPAVENNAPQPAAESPRATPAATNVIPLVDPRGNGSAAVRGDLGERYPNLAYDPPVGRW